MRLPEAVAGARVPSGEKVRGTLLPIAALLDRRVHIDWQEAVAVVSAADARSAATGIPITLEHCDITAGGEVHLSRPGAGDAPEKMSSLQLLAALLRGQASLNDLRVLAAGGTDSSAAGREGEARLRVNLHWCVSADPRADVARLAARALASGSPARGEWTKRPAQEVPPNPTPARTRTAVPGDRVKTPRHPAVTIRVQRLSPGVALAMAAVFVAVIGGGALIVAIVNQSGSSHTYAQSGDRPGPELPSPQPTLTPAASGEPAVSAVEFVFDGQAQVLQTQPVSAASR